MVEVHTFLPAGAQSLGSRRVSQVRVGLLVRPGELVALLAVVYHVGRQFVAQLLKVNAQYRLAVLVLALRHTLRKQPRYLVYVRACYVKALHL